MSEDGNSEIHKRVWVVFQSDKYQRKYRIYKATNF